MTLLYEKRSAMAASTKANKANFKKRSKRMQENQVSLFSRGGYSEAPGSRGPRHDGV